MCPGQGSGHTDQVDDIGSSHCLPCAPPEKLSSKHPVGERRFLARSDALAIEYVTDLPMDTHIGMHTEMKGTVSLLSVPGKLQSKAALLSSFK
eukprot:180661-Amphidinium_carterae.1